MFTSTAAGQYYRLLGAALVTEQRSSYSDAGTVSQAGKTRPVHASATVYDGGVRGDGSTPAATPTPTPSESTSQTPSPSPSESTSETPSPSSSQTPSPTPSVTGSTPATSPTTSSPTPPPGDGQLPQTGTDANPLGVGVGVVLLVAGGGTLLAARRRRR